METKHGPMLIIVIFMVTFMTIDFTFGQYFTSRVNDQTCSDRRTRCSDNQTCCPTGGGNYGCCPYAGATCCRDQRSCCPQGYNCNVTSRSCYRSRAITKVRNQQPWSVVQFPVPAVNETINNNNIDDEDDNSRLTTVVGLTKKLCPDGKQTCPESYTCCAEATGGYGCCPLTGGICCPDRVHCCPMGTQCNTKIGSCDG